MISLTSRSTLPWTTFQLDIGGKRISWERKEKGRRWKRGARKREICWEGDPLFLEPRKPSRGFTLNRVSSWWSWSGTRAPRDDLWRWITRRDNALWDNIGEREEKKNDVALLRPVIPLTRNWIKTSRVSKRACKFSFKLLREIEFDRGEFIGFEE